MDMRDFINHPNGQSKQSLAANERVETDHTQSPLGGRTVWFFSHGCVKFLGSCLSQPVYFLQDVFDLPFHMARNQIEESLRNKMASIKVIFFPFTTRSFVTVVKGIIVVLC